MHAGGRSSATEASEVPLQSPGSCECHCRSHGRSLTSAEVLLTLTFKKHAVMWSIAMFGFAVRQGWAFAHRLQGSSILKLCLESRRVSFLLRSGTLCCRTLWEAGTLHCALFSLPAQCRAMHATSMAPMCLHSAGVETKLATKGGCSQEAAGSASLRQDVDACGSPSVWAVF